MSTILFARRERCAVRRAVWLVAALVLPLMVHAGNLPQLESSSRDAVEFSLRLDAPGWQRGLSGRAGEVAWEAQLPGFVNTASPAQVRLPRRSLSLLVPPGTRPQLEVLSEEWRSLDGRWLAVEPVATMVVDPETGEGWEQPWVPGAGVPLPTERVPRSVLEDYRNPDRVATSGPAVRLGEVSWWRGRRTVSVTLLPVQADGEGRAVRALASGRWRIRFVNDPTADKALPAGVLQRVGNRGDERFSGSFLNGDLLTSLPTEAAFRGILPGGKARGVTKGTPLGYPEVRLPVGRTQLVRVRYSQLVALGLVPGDVTLQESQIRLYQRQYLADYDDPSDDQARPYAEVEVPIHMVGEGDAFADDDLFLFWGLRPADDVGYSREIDGVVRDLEGAADPQELNNEFNIYWLQLADPEPGESWARMNPETLPASTGTPLDSYRRIDRFDEAVAYRENVTSVNTDRYCYNSVLSQNAVVPLNFWAPVPGQTTAVLRAGLANFSSSPKIMAIELVQGDAVFARLDDYELPGNQLDRVYSDAIPADALTAGNISVRVRRENASLRMFSFLDWVEIDYRALYSAPFGRLRFPGGDPDVLTGNLEIDGFPLDELGLIEITDPRNPRFVDLTAANLVTVGESLTLSLQIDQSAGQRRFYAATRMFSNGVSDVDYNQASLQTDATPPTQLAEDGADVLVVCHPEFREQAEAWIQYRRARDPDLTIHVVEPQALYDWYTGGLKNPWAIKRLVNHALASPGWGSWALVLLGGANENPRELGVASDGRQWSRDWVPTHFHVQDVGQGLPPEVLASDMWFGYPPAGNETNFPGGNNITGVPSLYIGRIPCDSPADLARVLGKIQQVEAGDGQAWRRRGIFLSDDAWSSGTLDAGGFTIEYHGSELAFEQSENRVLADRWANNAGMVSLVVDTVMLRPFMTPLHPSIDMVVGLEEARNFCEESGATTSLINALNAGATLAHYQGHANHYVMAHENWLLDSRINNYRFDLDRITNVGRPWLFCGMGCHLGDFIQNVAGPNGNTEPGLGEKLLFLIEGGAVAVYASSGYEFLSTNKTFSEVFIDVLAISPPRVTVDGRDTGTRWMLGELMWKSGQNMLGISQSSTVREMVYQYSVLGDPLLMLDAGPPEVEAALVGGGPLEAQTALVALDGSNRRVVNLQARDEAGIDRLVVRDSAGNDLTASTVEATPFYPDGRTQIMDYVITLPVRPFPHDITVGVYDASDRLDTDPHPSFTLSVAHEWTATFTADGTEVDPESNVFQPGVPVDFSVAVTTAAWLDEATTVELQGDHLELSAITWSVLDSDHLEASFTATAPAAKANRGVRLLIDGFETYVSLETSPIEPADGGVTGLVNFPNPMRGETRFVFGTNVLSGTGVVRVWTVSGRSVAEVPFTLGGNGREVVSWAGVDRERDRLANGTYLYRVELDGPLGRVRSDMQRLVIMR
ncbi:MAG: C25 family cysteine peptidase [Candidatus Krumholzibacteriia bacterium]